MHSSFVHCSYCWSWEESSI